jgi:hypothetical protein
MAGRAKQTPYVGLDSLVRHHDQVTTVRALYEAGLLRLREVKNFRERRGRVGTRWFADIIASERQEGACTSNSGWMIRRRDYVYLRDHVEPLRHVGPIGARHRQSPLADKQAGQQIERLAA